MKEGYDQYFDFKRTGKFASSMNKTAALMDRDKRSLEKIGIPAAVNIGNVMALRIKLAVEDKPSEIKQIVREYMSHMHPIILDGMVAGVLSGRLRMAKIAAQGIATRKHALGAYDEALAYYRKRMGLSTDDVDALKKTYSAKALKVVKGASDMVERKAQEAIAESLKLGEHVKDAQARLQAAMNTAGVDEASPWLCETITRTNIAAAYSAGNHQALQDPDLAEFHIGYRYATVGDARVRETHEEWDGFVGPKDDEFWQTHYPPCGYNCRCCAIPLFSDYESNIPEDYEDADDGINPVTGLDWGTPPESD